WLLELADLDLEAVPVVDVDVGVLDARLSRQSGGLGVAEIGQQTEFVGLEQGGLDTEASAAVDEGVDVGVISAVEGGTVVCLDLAGEAQVELLVGRAEVEVLVLVIPAGQGTALAPAAVRASGGRAAR